MNGFKKLAGVLTLSLFLAPQMANATSIWGSTDRGPVQGTYRIPTDTSSSSSPGYITPAELQTYLGGGGSVSVTAGTKDIVINPTPGTGTFTVGSTQLVNALGSSTGTYTVLTTDLGGTITSTQATSKSVTIPTAGSSGFGQGSSFSYINLGVGSVTFTSPSATINGQSSLTLTSLQSAWFISDPTGNWVAFEATGVGSFHANTFQLNSTLTVANDQTNWVTLPTSGVFVKAYAICKTAPTGASAIFDIQLSTNNGASFTSLFATHASYKPTIAASSNNGSTTSFDTANFAVGNTLRIDTDQIGSSTAGANCTVTLVSIY